jgi:hypothetical protein
VEGEGRVGVDSRRALDEARPADLTVVNHPEAFHDRARAGVVHLGERHDLGGAELVGREAEGLGADPVA